MESNEFMESSDSVTIDRATADKEFDRLCKSWKINIKKDTAGSAEVIKEALMDGFISIRNDKGEGVKLTVRHELLEPINKDITYLEYKFAKASDMAQMDDYLEHQHVKKMMALVAAVTNVGRPLIGNLCGRDLMLGQAIGGLFLVA